MYVFFMPDIHSAVIQHTHSHAGLHVFAADLFALNVQLFCGILDGLHKSVTFSFQEPVTLANITGKCKTQLNCTMLLSRVHEATQINFQKSYFRVERMFLLVSTMCDSE